MHTLLAITVGGSCAPVVTAIKDYQPDFVLFIASGGERGSRKTIEDPQKPCQKEDKTPEVNILQQTGLQEGQYSILEVSEPDTLHLCYEETRRALLKFGQERQGWRKIADYTGGTKTMTAALAIVALELGWELSIVRGNRTDLQKVRDGTEMSSLVNTGEVRARQQLEQAERLFNQFAYASANELLESLARSTPLSPELQRSVQKVVTLCRGFDAWDRFDHARAAQILNPYRDEITPQWQMLKKILGEMKVAGYEYAPVFDLVSNAERRAERGRYDDAVARLYRALEMLAQIRLKQLGLDASNLNVSQLPESVRSMYAGKTGKIKLGLLEDYDLLAALDDPLGKFYSPYRKKLLATLEKRNSSILAHGTQPCNAAIYDEMHSQVWQFITDGLKTLSIIFDVWQFPTLEQGQITTRKSSI